MNQYAVGAVGKKIEINNLANRPRLTPKEAIELAAWLAAATALPLQPGDALAELGKFVKRRGRNRRESGEDALAEAVRAELEE
jgi:hypothetical protein